MIQNSCQTKKGQQCSLIPGESYVSTRSLTSRRPLTRWLARSLAHTTVTRYPYQSFGIGNFLDDNPSQPVLTVKYPAGSWSPGSPKPGGVLNYAFPTKTNPFEKTYPVSNEGATLEYDVYFPDNFEFVKGGKLPGLMGGASNGIGCGGGNRNFDCFSYRLMWRRNGYGEAYIYAPFPSFDPGFCSDLPPCDTRQTSVACNHCQGETGHSIGRATFQFPRGQWTRLKLQMRLNTPGVANGILRLSVNGNVVIDRGNMVWRTDPSVNIEGVNIASWFGGSNDSWSPSTDQELKMKNFRMFYDGVYEQAARAATTSGSGRQTVVEMAIEEGV